jgi:hypothetical protein
MPGCQGSARTAICLAERTVYYHQPKQYQFRTRKEQQSEADLIKALLSGVAANSISMDTYNTSIFLKDINIPGHGQ